MSSTRIVALAHNKRPSIPELGRIRLGEPKTDPKRPGKPLPYFRVEFDPKYTHLLPLWNELYPVPPSRLDNIFMAEPDADGAFTTGYEEWGAAKVLHRRCDGNTIHQWYDTKSQRYQFTEKPCQCPIPGKGACRPVGRLTFIVKDFYEFCASRGVNALGYFLMATSSLHNINRIDQLLQGTQAQYKTVQRIPFLLERVAEEQSTPIPENKDRGTPATRVMKTHYLITLRTADAFAPFAAETLLAVGPQPVALAPVATMPQLPAAIQAPVDDDVIQGDYVEPERWDVSLTGVTVALDNKQRRFLRFTTDLGELVAYRRSRDIFIAGGYIKEGDWQEVKTYEFAESIPAVIEQDGEYWQVISVGHQNVDK